jgi:hypothetical protein
MERSPAGQGGPDDSVGPDPPRGGVSAGPGVARRRLDRFQKTPTSEFIQSNIVSSKFADGSTAADTRCQRFMRDTKRRSQRPGGKALLASTFARKSAQRRGMTILGIDPGAHGAVAVLDEARQLLDMYDMPSTVEANGRTATNAPLLAAILARTKARICQQNLNLRDARIADVVKEDLGC